ncbi:uncharacterized protein RCC_04147 [Ramularia collo-cygni]|uniref:DUF3328 domain protein n=1 Tax=Ramularia collo-cygni TaxID=112498 RepID=A0A2D3VCQ1_9PEZI|nr:uncharacterized protein RCC_04147 [Ramularia collo-cygni]CZT18303.1 uncharacterized protein RCC_04147 [Ramularia collo-cygni]
MSRKWGRTSYWILSVGTLLNVALFCGTVLIYMQSQSPSTPGPLKSDIKDAWDAVQYETRTFTGALKWDRDSGNLHREQDYSVEYFGPPSDKLDEIWEELLHDEFVPMTKEESSPFLPDLRDYPGKDTPLFEPGLFHSLHCLNALRKLVSKHMYNSTSTLEEDPKDFMPSEIAHNEHCMDRIRQSLICAGDLTPSPMYWWDGFGMAVGRTGPQTCRKWQPIREWMDGRREHNDSQA